MTEGHGDLRSGDYVKSVVGAGRQHRDACIRLGHGILLKRDGGLCQQPAVCRCAGVHGNIRLGQHDAFHVRGGSDRHCAGDLPEHVLRLCTAGQRHQGRVGLGQGSRDLEDEDIVRATRQRDIRRDQDTGPPLVEARNERQPANLAGTQFGEVGRAASGGVGIRQFHVAHRRGQQRGVGCRARQRAGGVDGVDLAGLHFTAGQADRRTGDGAGANIAIDRGFKHVRDP